MSITSIRTRQPVDIGADELRLVIESSMGAKLTSDTSKFVFVDNSEISTAAYLWNEIYSARPFANTESALAVMLDILGEQLATLDIETNEGTEL